jgi:hypothetical protein
VDGVDPPVPSHEISWARVGTHPFSGGSFTVDRLAHNVFQLCLCHLSLRFSILFARPPLHPYPYAFINSIGPRQKCAVLLFDNALASIPEPQTCHGRLARQRLRASEFEQRQLAAPRSAILRDSRSLVPSNP